MTAAKLPRSLALAASVASVLAGLAAAQAQAQAPQPVLTPAVVPVPASPYRDRVIDAGSLPSLPPDEDDAVDRDGLPRALRVELNLASSERGGDSFTEQGIAAGGFWESASWGSFSLDATVFQSDRARLGNLGGVQGPGNGLGGSATLWQRRLYVDGGWRVDNGLGVLNTPSLPLLGNQYRFLLPTVPFAGASSQWVRESGGLQLHGAIGRAGIYSGTRVIGFDLADGQVAALGAQWSWAPQWTGAAAFLGTSGRIVPDDLGEAVFETGDTRALHASTAWQGARDQVQFNLLSSRGDDSSAGPLAGAQPGQRQATGAWIDANARRGRYTHHYGVFRLQPGLAWGALPINNDIQGGYYRLGYQYGRWLWNGSIDSLQSVSGNGFDGSYATGFTRYQASNTLGVGASVSLRRAPALSHSAQLFADKRTGWGQTRLQLDQASGDGGDSWQLALDQAFDLQQGARLSASLAFGALATAGEQAERTTTVALNGGRDLTDRISVDGNARWMSADGTSAQRGLDLNLSLNWRISPRWALATSVYQSQGSRRSPFILDPLVTETPFISTPRERSVFLTLRYERQAGQPLAVMGGAPGAAVGSIAGSVYLDDNDDGARAASEQLAANITVVLDGRYSVRTDAAGRFAFPRVAVGSHTLTVLPDNLPLPWFVDEAPRPIEVSVRGSTRADIGARRNR